MNVARNRKLWVDALRSYEGNVVQLMSGRWKYDPIGLHTGFNCIGVALELMDDLKKYPHPSKHFILYGEDRYAGGFPPEAKEYYGFARSFPRVFHRNEIVGLTVLQDRPQPYTMKQMADLIEQQSPDWDGSYMQALQQSLTVPH